MSMKILIADNDWRFSHQAAEFLESHAHLVVRSTDAESTLETAEQWKPDLVMVSESMTENGLLERLHAMPNRPAVLLLGWMDRYAKVWRAWQRGGDELLMKPVFKSQELYEAIVTAMENATADAQPQRLAS